MWSKKKKVKGVVNNKVINFHQIIDFENDLLNLMTISKFRYFCSDTKKKWYFGYYDVTGTWVTMKSFDKEKDAKEMYNKLKNILIGTEE